MTALPSFVELMASLGLESPKQDPTSSPAIVVSAELDPIEDRHTRPRVARYSPYSAPVFSHSRRRSDDSIDLDSSNRAASASPRLRARISGHRPVSLNLGADSRHGHAAPDTDMTANTPISSFVRRKSPQSSPISPTFAQRTRSRARMRSQSPTAPVSLPTLPSVLFQSSSSSSSSSPSPEDQCSLADQQENCTFLAPDYSTEDYHSPHSPIFV